MIQSLNSVNTANCCGGKRKQSFGDKMQDSAEPPVIRAFEPPVKRPSRAKRLAAFTGMQFAIGAIVSGVFDGLANLWNAVLKNKPLIPFGEIVGKAIYVGSAFAVIGLVLTAISAAMSGKNK